MMDSAQNPIISALARTVQAKLPQGYELLRIMDLTALFVDVDLIDQESKRRYYARIYRAPESSLDQAFELWQKHSSNLTNIRHPNLLPSRGLMRLGSLAVHLSDYLPLLDLAHYQSQVGICGAEYAIRLIIDLLRTLENALAGDWSRQNLHPRDIGLLNNGGLVLRHFGLFSFESSLAESLELTELWDPTYMSPEHLKGERILGTSITYQAAALLYQLVVGQPPFVGNFDSIREGHLKRPVGNPQASNRAIQTGLARVLMKALAKNTYERFDSCGDFIQTLGMLLPLHERVAYAAHQGPVYVKLSEKEKERLADQIHTAAEQYGAQAYDEALHTVSAVLLIAYDHPQALELSREIWLERHRLSLETTWEQALELEREGDKSQSLACIQRFLSLAPEDGEALGLQSELLESLAGQDADLHQRVPIQATMERAAVADTLDERWLAEGLWFQVLLTGALPGESFTDLVQMQKNLARQGLEHYHAGLFPERKEEVASADADDFELDMAFERLGVGAEAARSEQGEEKEPANGAMKAEASLDAVARAEANFEAKPVERPAELPADRLLLPKVPPPMPSSPKQATPATRVVPPPPAVPELPEPAQLLRTRTEPVIAPPQAPAPPPSSAEPPPAPPTQSRPHPRKKTKTWLLAIAFLLVLAACATWFFRYKRHNDEVQAVIAKLEQLEQAGDWPGALEQWRESGKKYPDEKVFAERANRLAEKMETRDKQIEDAVTKGRRQLSQGVLGGNGDNNVEFYLHSAEKLLEDHPLVVAFREEIRSSEMARARSLLQEGLLAAARANYDQLLKLSPTFKDSGFESELQTGLRDQVLDPGLKALSAALKKRQFDKAFEIGDDLRAQMGNVPELAEAFAPLAEEAQAKLEMAREKQRRDLELAALELLARINPGDSARVSERDQLSRELNEAKIADAEARIEKGMAAEDWLVAGRAAAELAKIDSGNPKAKQSLAQIEAKISKRVAELERGNLRAALAFYEPYASIFKGRQLRKKLDDMRARVAAFDSESLAAQRLTGKQLEEQRQAITRVLERYSDLSGDAQAEALRRLRADLDREGAALGELLEWESEARNDGKVRYQEIIDHLQQAGPFKTTSARDQVAQLVANYQRRIENYQGEAVIVIVGVRAIPKPKGVFAGLPDPICQLKAAGQTLRTPPLKNELNPTWNYECKLKADGKALEFQLLADAKGKSLGTIALEKFPPSGRQEFTAKEGWKLILEVKRGR